MGYSVVDVSDLPGEGPGGVVKKARRALGARAFGFNWFELPAGTTGLEHDETGTGQEEVIVVIAGSGTMRIDGEQIELKPGRLIRIDPGSTRCPTAAEAGLTFITFGAPLEGRYEPPAWG
jgi:mannose-6-phosphate isomerase-like protein (cupin superfamily)